MKVILDYNPATGELNDKNGMYIATWQNLQAVPFEETQQKQNAVDDLVALKAAGFTAAEIIELKKSQVIK